VTGSLSTAELLTGTTAGVVAVVTLGLAQVARRAGMNLVGLTAPVVAAGIAFGWFGPRITIAWNLFGLAMLVNAIGTVATSTPGKLHLNWPGEPFTAIATWPVIWIPALLAPIGIFLHTVSIRQSIARFASHG
jgi:hypothetical protein